jgi:hypothetical protein
MPIQTRLAIHSLLLLELSTAYIYIYIRKYCVWSVLSRDIDNVCLILYPEKMFIRAVMVSSL